MFGRLKHLAGVETRAQTISPGLIGRTYTVYIALPLPFAYRAPLSTDVHEGRFGFRSQCPKHQQRPDSGDGTRIGT